MKKPPGVVARALLLLAALAWLVSAASFVYQSGRALPRLDEMPPLVVALVLVALTAGVFLIVSTVRAPRSHMMARLGQRFGAAPVLLLSLFDLASSGWSKDGAWVWLVGAILALLLLPLLPAVRIEA